MTVQQWTDGISINLVSSLIFALMCLAYVKYSNLVQRLHPYARPATLIAILVIALGINLVALESTANVRAILLVFTAVLSAFLVLRELNQFWIVGIVGADRSISTGVTFEKSLNLCRNSIRFLGVGASKLVGTGSTFEEALLRCQRDDSKLQFLLSNPNNPELVTIARRARKNDAEYAIKVRDSIRTIARFAKQADLRIEVRLYSGELPHFRLMYIDNELCLASPSLFGEGDGSQLPQLHLRKRIGGRRDKESIYYQFELYFDDLWQKSTIANLDDYAGELK